MALLFVSDTEVECVPQLDRVTWNSILMIDRKQIFCDEIVIELPPYTGAGYLTVVNIFVEGYATGVIVICKVIRANRPQV